MTSHATTRLLLCLAAALLLTASQAPAADDAAKLAPEDTIVYAVVPNFQAVFDKFKETAVYGLYREPAMQPCIGPTEKKITDLIDKGLAEMWGEIGLENPPKELPWPQGRVTVIFRMGKVKRKIQAPGLAPPVGGGNAKMEEQEITDDEPQVVVLAEMGKNAEPLKRIVKGAIDKSVEKGVVRKVRETVRGVDVDVLTPKRGDKEVVPGSEPMPCLAFKDELFIAGSDFGLLKDVLTRMGGADQPSLADDAGLKAVRATLPDPGQAMVYFNAKGLVDFTKANADADEKEQILKVLSVLGFDNVQGVGLTFEMAPNKVIDFRVKVQVAIRGARGGIPALLTPPSMTTKPGALLTKGLSGFIVANYDVSKIFEQVIKMIDAGGGVNSEKSLQESMDQTRGEGGQPPVNLKNDVFGQLGSPITVLFRHGKSLAAEDGMKFMLAIGTRDAKVLDAAIGRIHDTFLASHNKDLRRELLNTKIYVIPNILAMMQGGGSSMGLAVVGDQLTFGSLNWIEQCIREQGKGKAESIATDPMYQHVANYLPAQAGVVTYQNNQIVFEALWDGLKDAAKEAAKAPRNQPAGGVKGGPTDFQAGPAPRQPGRAEHAPSMLLPLVEELREYIDFTTLPEFSAIKKYFGASTWYLSGNDQGIYIEALIVKAPAE